MASLMDRITRGRPVAQRPLKSPLQRARRPLRPRQASTPAPDIVGAPSGTQVQAAAYEPASGITRILIVVVLFATPALIPLFAGTPVHDPDIWWHLATGKWIAEHGALPTVDPFHVGERASAWVPYSWLFEVGVHKGWTELGLRAFFVYSLALSLAVTAAIYHLIRRVEPRFVPAVLLTALTATAVWPWQGARTYLITILFSVVTLDVLWAARRGRPRALVLLPPLFALWANLHIQFVYGLMIVGLAFLESVIDRIRGLPDWYIERDGFPLRWMLGTTVLCSVATLATPFGLDLYRVVYEYATQLAPWTYLAELRAPTFRTPFDWLVLALALGGAFALGRRGALRPFTLLLLVAAAGLSFRAMRDAWLVAMTGAVLIADGGLAFQRPRLGLFGASRFVAATAGLALALGVAWTKADTAEAALQSHAAVRFPAAAVRFIEEKGYRGPVFNHSNWGGYLIWHLPSHEVAIDGRTNVYGDRAIERSMRTWAGLPGWDEDPLLKKAGVVLAPVNEPLTSVLRSDWRFQRVYADELAEVYVPR